MSTASGQVSNSGCDSDVSLLSVHSDSDHDDTLDDDDDDGTGTVDSDLSDKTDKKRRNKMLKVRNVKRGETQCRKVLAFEVVDDHVAFEEMKPKQLREYKVFIEKEQKFREVQGVVGKSVGGDIFKNCILQDCLQESPL